MDKEDTVRVCVYIYIYHIYMIYISEYYSATTKEYRHFSNMDGPRDYTKWSKPDRERQISYYITYTQSQKNTKMKLFIKQKQAHRHWKQIYGYPRGKEGRDKLGVQD